MTEAGLLKELILVFGFTFGFIIVGYEEHASTRGWPVGEWLRGMGLIKILGFLVMLGAIVSSLIITPWWFVFITVIGGILIGFCLSNIFRSSVQVIAIIGTIACYIAAPFFLW